MAKTYEQYEHNRATSRGMTRSSTEERIGAALDQTELLKSVRRRVQAFVDAYETDIVPEVLAADTMRERGFEARAEVVLADTQNIRAVQDEEGLVRLLLDDVKVLLDQFPQQDW